MRPFPSLRVSTFHLVSRGWKGSTERLNSGTLEYCWSKVDGIIILKKRPQFERQIICTYGKPVANLFWSQLLMKPLTVCWGRLCTTRNGDTHELGATCICVGEGWRGQKKKKNNLMRLFHAIEPRRRSIGMRGSRKPSPIPPRGS